MKRFKWKRWFSTLCVILLVLGLMPAMGTRTDEVVASSEQYVKELAALLSRQEETSGVPSENEVGEKYETARLMVLANEKLDMKLVTKATNKLYDGRGMWVLQFNSADDAKAADAALEEKGITAAPDTYVKLNSFATNLTEWANGTHCSWGVNYCGFPDYIRRHAAVLDKGYATIAIIDTGIDVNHPIFDGFTGWFRRGVDYYGMNFKNLDFHGTAVAGIVTECIGPVDMDILDMRAGSPYGTASNTAVVSAIKDAADMGADVINCSLGEYLDGWPETRFMYEEAIRYAAQKGAVVVCAAGNDGRKLNPVGVGMFYPACVQVNNCVCVGSITQSGARASGSNYGSVVDLCAPGPNMKVAMPSKKYGRAIDAATSFAAAFVSAAIALDKIATVESPGSGNVMFYLRSSGNLDMGKFSAWRRVNPRIKKLEPYDPYILSPAYR